ncbi:hypothetical protein DFH08DRAFT_359864 [Mycena albidolilacea]|uniref:Uncharacterized protein n=1 Tax=Mycena albidolilacea TaxID=1033008 RepID=A0AAD7AJK1_9AGAR|nr:hypothetical protein DFH08DRAFT_359864 [Mycena albidolilacea]
MCFLFWTLPLTTTRTYAWQATTLGFHLDVSMFARVLFLVPCRAAVQTLCRQLDSKLSLGLVLDPTQTRSTKDRLPILFNRTCKFDLKFGEAEGFAAGCLAVPQERPRGPWG